MPTSTEQRLIDLLVGEWDLVSMAILGADGTKTELWGDDGFGVISYSATGRMYVGTSRGDRPVLAEDDATDAEAAQAWRTCTAYWGTYQVEADDGADHGVVTHFPIGSSMQHYVGTQQPRKFRFEDDLLFIQRHPSGNIRSVFRRVR